MLNAAHHVRLVLTALAVASLAVLAGPVSPSWAHAELISSTPADGATLGTAPATVALTFSDPVAAQFVRVAVTTPAGTGTVAATTKGSVVTVPVPAQGPGAYRVVYRVVSADGHPVSGTLTFTVAGTPTASPSPSGTSAGASPSADASSAGASPSASSIVAVPASGADGTDGGSGWVVYAAIALAVLAGAGALALAVGRGRQP